ncbi:hypothetical protein EON67_01570 [archaeon]|nr:MAG: hypothetical protein EON67_01570 [archaeon]
MRVCVLAGMTAQAAQQIGINLLAANKQPMGAGAGAAVAPIMQATTIPPTAMIVAGGADAASRAASATPCILIKNMFDPATETEAVRAAGADAHQPFAQVSCS